MKVRRGGADLHVQVLIVERKTELAAFLVQAFQREQHVATSVSSREAATTTLSAGHYDVVLLGADADDEHVGWCRAARARGIMVPILLLCSNPSVEHCVEAIDAGADDVLRRPFALAELRARVRALVRRPPAMSVIEVTHGDVRVQLGTRMAWVARQEVSLTAREWSVIELIVQRRGHLVARSEVLDSIWGAVTEANDASLDVIIGRVRKKLGAGFIRTVRGEGFVLR